ncbi:MAG: heme o synthase [Chitinophagales bacterium]
MIFSGKISIANYQSWLKAKIQDYLILVKFRLNFTVVFSSAIGYLLAAGTAFDLWSLLILSLGGFLVTSSANAINQVLEKDYDKLMPRTQNRPLATGRMTVGEGVLIAGLTGIGGLLLLGWYFSSLVALIAAVSLISYGFVYTPLKRISPIAVFVGAIPGALPPMIGWVAVSGVITFEAYVLFAIQFLWQFPHFWAIGWLGADAYKNAGYKLVPTPETKNPYTAFQAVIYILALILVSIIPSLIGIVGYTSIVAGIILGGMFLAAGINLVRKCDNKAALQLMFASIIYLVLLQVVMVIDRMFIV